jgi:hypothetical protein
MVAPACVDQGVHQLGTEEQALIMYWRIRDLWGPVNLVASTVAELDNTLPHFMDVQWDSVWVTHGCPLVIMWKTTLGQGRTRPDSFIVIAKGGHSWCLHS